MSYCKLYIDVDLDQDRMEGLFSQGFEECLNDIGVDYTLFSNDSYIKTAQVTSSTYPVDRSRYYVEIDSAPDSKGREDDFNEAISRLVIWLRRYCDFVVASCDFEDYIFEVTGWNWTPEQPIPPAP